VSSSYVRRLQQEGNASEQFDGNASFGQNEQAYPSTRVITLNKEQASINEIDLIRQNLYHKLRNMPYSTTNASASKANA